MKYILLALAVISSTAQAAPWNKDCVTFWGGKIAVEDRTPENCPTNHSHWDAAVPGSGTASNYVSQGNTAPNYNTQAMITTNSGNYIVVPNQLGGAYPRAVIQVSRGK